VGDELAILQQYTLPVLAADDETRLDDVWENQDRLGFLADHLCRRLARIETLQGGVGVSMERVFRKGGANR
jgi:hypothetical protein